MVQLLVFFRNLKHKYKKKIMLLIESLFKKQKIALFIA